jgi:hypothetical protein
MRSALTSRIRCALIFTTAAVIANPVTAAIDAASASRIFDEARTLCERDAGALWGHTLCGPLMLVDPTDLSIIANQVDAGGKLKPAGAWFAGTLPPNEILANTTIEWSGTRWSEILWPLPDDDARRHVLIAHELFHRIQTDLNMPQRDGGNHHLDTLEGRYLLQLEWRALTKALDASAEADRIAAIKDALLFRHQRYRLFAQAATEEAALELHEGVSEYTGVRLGLTTQEARIRFAIHDLTAFVDSPSFVRSFAYATGPAYGLLLDHADPEWRSKLHAGQQFDLLLGAALKLPESNFTTLETRQRIYDDGTLRDHEGKRDEQRRTRLQALKSKLVDGPVLTLPLNNSSYQFNPQTLQPLGEHGTVYPTLRLSDDWGVLEVSDDALLNQVAKRAAVATAGFDAATLKADGWKLKLNNGWTVQPGARESDLVVKQSGGGGE